MEKEQLVSLVKKAQQGDSAATNELFNAFYNDLYYFALKTVKDDDLALDITQEAFVEIINTLGNLKEPAAFVTWAKQITYHQCTRYFKKKKDVLVDEDEDGNTVFDDLKEENAEFIPDEALDQSDFKKTILSLLDELSEEQRSAVMMYYFDEMSVGQIAEIQGVSEGTVKSRLNYARKTIKASVEDYEKKHNIKLHAVPFLPFIKWIFGGSFGGGMPAASAQLIAEGVSSATGTTITASATGATTATATATTATATAATTTAATTTTTAAVGIGAKIAAIPLATKIIAATVAAAVTIGGATTAVILSDDKNTTQPTDTQSIVESVEDTSSENNPTEETTDELVLEGIIPDGCTYTLADGTVLTAGQPFPETCTAGDHVAYGDYLYGYECIYMGHADGAETDWYMWKDGFDSGDSGVIESDVFGSWSIMVADQSKSSYGAIVSKINGKPIKTLDGTFFGCSNMTEAPKIPSTITAMPAAYWGCSSLMTAPTIPANVERIMMSFKDCTSLKGDVIINAKLDKSLEWYYSETFSGTVNNINLTGNTPEEDLTLIAKLSDNKNITVNGKAVDYGADSNETNNPDEQPEQQPEQQPENTPDEENDIIEQVRNTASNYISRLLYSGLPNFSSVEEISYSNAFWFVFYGIDREPYYVGEDADGALYYEIPVSVFTLEAKKIFGIEYDFTNLYEYDVTGTWQAGYTPVNGGEDVVIVVCKGGGGTDYHPELTKIVEMGDNKYQAYISWYSASSEKPTDENADYYETETGYYWIADKWEIITLEIVKENNGDITTRIISYLEK